MARLALEIQIQAPANRVAAFFVPQRMPYWFGSEIQAEFEVQGGAPDFAAGQKIRITGRMGGREVTLTTVVTAFEPGHLLEWRFTDAYGVKGLQSWELQPRASGTVVRMRDNYEMPGIPGFLDAIFTRHAVARRDRAWLQKLKQLAERS